MNQSVNVYFRPGLLVLCCIVIGAIVTLVYRQRTFINQFSDEYVWQLNISIQQATRDYLLPAETVAKLASGMFTKGTLSFSNLESFESYASAVSDQYPQLSAIFVGTESEEFWFWLNGVDSEYDHAIRSIFPDNALEVNGSRHENWRYFDTGGMELRATNSDEVDYFPSQRPWYKGAMVTGESYWTDAYIFATLGVTGITAAYPIQGPDGKVIGAWGVDILLEELSQFLEDITSARSAELAIINSEKKVVAYSSQWEHTSDSELPKLHDVASLPVQEALKSYDKHGFSEFFLDYQNDRYMVSIAPLFFEGVQDWSIVIVIPDNELLSQLDGQSFVVLILSVTLFILSMALVFSTGIQRWFSLRLNRANANH